MGEVDVRQAPSGPAVRVLQGPDLDGLRRVTFAAVQEVTTDAGAVAIDWNVSLRWRVVLTADTTIAFVDPPGPCSGLIWIVQGGAGGFTPSFPLTSEGPPLDIVGAAGARSLVGAAFDGSVWTLVTPGKAMTSPPAVALI